MFEQCYDLMEVPEVSKNAMGGTELTARKLYSGTVPRELLEKFQIVLTRMTGSLKEDKVRLYWCQDLPGDPEVDKALKDGGWKRFNKLIFVSTWQMLQMMGYYQIPWSHCLVIQNFIEPIEQHEKPNDGKIHLAYWTTPHRGLNILYPVFEKLYEVNQNITLDVYSSFQLYGWAARDEQFQSIFDKLEAHPAIYYHKSISNELIRDYIKTWHIFAYPSVWAETSCICLMEAMSGGMLPVHSNYGALYETAANWTNMYQFHENQNVHAGIFYNALKASIDSYWTPEVQNRLKAQKAYADTFYSWNKRADEWLALLNVMSKINPAPVKQESAGFFEYKAGG